MVDQTIPGCLRPQLQLTSICMSHHTQPAPLCAQPAHGPACLYVSQLFPSYEHHFQHDLLQFISRMSLINLTIALGFTCSNRPFNHFKFIRQMRKWNISLSAVLVNVKWYFGPLFDRFKLCLWIKTPHYVDFAKSIAILSSSLLVFQLRTDILLACSSSTQCFA